MASAAVTARRTVTRNVAGMLTARTVVAGAGLVSLPVVYHRLGPPAFGVWALLSGLVTVAALVDLGLGSATVRQVAATLQGEGHEGGSRRTRATLGLGLVWGIVLALATMATTVAAWTWFARLLNLGELAAEARRALLWLLLGLLFDGVALPWRGILEGTQRYTTLAWITGSTALLSAVLAALVVYLGGGLAALGASAAAICALRTAMVVTAARRARAISPSLRGLRLTDLRVLGGYGLRVQVTTASGAVNTELDRFILSGHFGPAVAGDFDLGARLVNLLRLPPAFALVALFPLAVSRTAEHGPAWLERFNVIATKYVTAFGAVGAAVLVVCADPLVRLWLGQPNTWAAAGIAILAPSYALNLAAGATGIVTRVEGRPGRETRYALGSVGLNLALTWPLLHVLGPAGVIVATSVAVAVSTIYFIASYHRASGRALAPLLRAMASPLISAVVAGCVGALAAPYLPDGPGRAHAALAVAGRASVVLLIAAVVLAATRFLEPDDRAWLGGMLRPHAARMEVGAR